MSGGEVLVVASKVKSYMKSAGLNTSAGAVEALSAKVREICDRAVQAAKSDGRKTVLDRDIG